MSIDQDNTDEDMMVTNSSIFSVTVSLTCPDQLIKRLNIRYCETSGLKKKYPILKTIRNPSDAYASEGILNTFSHTYIIRPPKYFHANIETKIIYIISISTITLIVVFL